MFAPLGMGKVGTVILMDSEAETTLKRTNVVLEEVRILI
jgi:hypothetical protein